MPTAIESAVQSGRQKLINNDAVLTGRLFSVYSGNVQKLTGELEALDRKIAEREATGQPVSPAWLFRQAQYENLIDQSYAAAKKFQQQGTPLLESNRQRMARHGTALANDLAKTAGVDRSTLGGVNEKAVENAVAALQADSPLGRVLSKYGDHNKRVIDDAIASGLARGRGTKKVTQEAMAGLQGDWSRARIDSTVRTETARATRGALMESYEAMADVLDGLRWVAAHSARTCPACLAMDGRVFPVKGARDLFHNSCRCLWVPVPKSTDYEYEDGAAWLARQDEATHVKVLGPKGAADFRAGRLSLSDFLGVHRDSTWGDSVRALGPDAALRQKEAGGLDYDLPDAPTPTPFVINLEFNAGLEPKGSPEPQGGPTEALPEGAVAAWASYGESGYHRINGQLRSGRQLDPDNYFEGKTLDQMKVMDSSFVHVATEDTTVYRGMVTDDPDFLSSLQPGAVLNDAAYLSTSRSREMAREFSSAGGYGDDVGVLFEIKLPAGSKHLDMEKARASATDEAEIVLPRNAQLVITSVRQEGGRTVITAEYLPKSQQRPARVDTPITGSPLQGSPTESAGRPFSPMNSRALDEQLTQELGRSRQWREKFGKDAENDWFDYKDQGYKPLNKALREGASLTPEQQRMVDTLDASFGKYALPGDVLLYRGLNFEGDAPERLRNLKPGDVLNDSAYLSATYEPRIASNFADRGDTNYLIEIETPKGSRVVPVDALGRAESELVFPRDTQLLILERRVDEQGRTVIRARVVDGSPAALSKPAKSARVDTPVSPAQPKEGATENLPEAPDTDLKKRVEEPIGAPVPDVSGPRYEYKELQDKARKEELSFLQQSSGAEKKAWGEYKTGDYETINRKLREKFDPASDVSLTRRLQAMDASFEKFTTDKVATVWRGVSLESGQEIPSFLRDLRPGAVIRDDGFVSTSYEQQIAVNFLQKDVDYLMEIDLPVGSHYAPIERFGEKALGESEWALPRGTQFVVTGVEEGVRQESKIGGVGMRTFTKIKVVAVEGERVKYDLSDRRGQAAELTYALSFVPEVNKAKLAELNRQIVDGEIDPEQGITRARALQREGEQRKKQAEEQSEKADITESSVIKTIDNAGWNKEISGAKSRAFIKRIYAGESYLDVYEEFQAELEKKQKRKKK